LPDLQWIKRARQKEVEILGCPMVEVDRGQRCPAAECKLWRDVALADRAQRRGQQA
jgi:hypothetical protein